MWGCACRRKKLGCGCVRRTLPKCVRCACGCGRKSAHTNSLQNWHSRSTNFGKLFCLKNQFIIDKAPSSFFLLKDSIGWKIITNLKSSGRLPFFCFLCLINQFIIDKAPSSFAEGLDRPKNYNESKKLNSSTFLLFYILNQGLLFIWMGGLKIFFYL